MFEIGQRIICVGRNGSSKRSAQWWESWKREWGITLPKRGRLYTVRDIRYAKDGTQRIRLCELVNPLISFTDAPDQEPWWNSAAFRPVLRRKTDISAFKAMLTPKKVLQDA